MTASAIFQLLREALEEAGMDYMLTGSFAGAIYGDPRGTNDIDILIEADPERLKQLHRRFPPERFHFDLEAALAASGKHSMFNVLDESSGWKIDFIFHKDREYDIKAFRRRIPKSVHGIPFLVIAPEDLVIAKLEWAKRSDSERQLRDVGGILVNQGSLLDRTYIEHWVEELRLQSQWDVVQKDAG